MTVRPASSALITPVLVSGCIVILVAFGIRSAFGVFQIPIAEEFGWLRAEFSMALAIQNLAWGIGQPLFSAFAERFGDRKSIVLGVLVYALGLVLSTYAITPGQHQLLAILVGFGVAGTGFGTILAVVGRAASETHRSMALAIVTAMGSGGQILGPPLAEMLLTITSWQGVFLVFAASIVAVLLVVPLIRAPVAPRAVIEERMGVILGRAFRDPSYTLIALGFFSCGYQLGFIVSHFPAFVTEACGPIMPGGLLDGVGISTTSTLGAVAIAVIGFANIGGTLLAGWAGSRYQRRHLLAGIYLARTVVSIAFIVTPMTPMSVLLFSLGMGSLWLATVPLTAGLVGYIYGLRYMGTLYGIVFLSHQIGSFVGIWLGGELYDLTGDYTLVWWIGIGVGLFSAIVHLPVRERPLRIAAT